MKGSEGGEEADGPGGRGNGREGRGKGDADGKESYIEWPISTGLPSPCTSMNSCTSSAIARYVCVGSCGESPWFLRSYTSPISTGLHFPSTSHQLPFPLPFPNLILPDPQKPTHHSINLASQIPCQRPGPGVSKGPNSDSEVVEGISLTDAPIILLRAGEAVHDNDGSMLSCLARWRPVEVVCEG